MKRSSEELDMDGQRLGSALQLGFEMRDPLLKLGHSRLELFQFLFHGVTTQPGLHRSEALFLEQFSEFGFCQATLLCPSRNVAHDRFQIHITSRRFLDSLPEQQIELAPLIVGGSCLGSGGYIWNTVRDYGKVISDPSKVLGSDRLTGRLIGSETEEVR